MCAETHCSKTRTGSSSAGGGRGHPTALARLPKAVSAGAALTARPPAATHGHSCPAGSCHPAASRDRLRVALGFISANRIKLTSK